MMKFLWIFILVGCVRHKAEVQISKGNNAEEEQTISQHCSEIESQGDIFELLRLIKLNTDEVFGILERGNSLDQGEELSLLAKDIQEKSDKVIFLSRSEWTINQWEEKITWELDRRDFKSVLGKLFAGGFEILEPTIHSVYYQGQERNDLKEKLQLQSDSGSIVVTYHNRSSSLELCQLQKTMMIILEVKFRNLKWITTRYFNLYIRP